MNRMIVAGSISAALAVILGAFGAHALKARLAAEQLQVFETGVRYQFYHAIGLIIVGILSGRLNSGLLNSAGYLFIAGTLFFSGSLYLLSTKQLLGIESWRFLGPVTPFGGLMFIAGWIMLATAAIKGQ